MSTYSHIARVLFAYKQSSLMSSQDIFVHAAKTPTHKDVTSLTCLLNSRVENSAINWNKKLSYMCKLMLTSLFEQ